MSLFTSQKADPKSDEEAPSTVRRLLLKAIIDGDLARFRRFLLSQDTALLDAPRYSGTTLLYQAVIAERHGDRVAFAED